MESEPLATPLPAEGGAQRAGASEADLLRAGAAGEEARGAALAGALPAPGAVEMAAAEEGLPPPGALAEGGEEDLAEVKVARRGAEAEEAPAAPRAAALAAAAGEPEITAAPGEGPAKVSATNGLQLGWRRLRPPCTWWPCRPSRRCFLS